MKKIIIGCWMALGVATAALAQQTEIVNFRGEVKVEDTNQQQLYQRLLTWHNENLPEESLQKVDRKNGEFSGTSFMHYTSKINAASDLTQGFVLYDFKVQVTDNGFQYVLTNFRHEGKIKFHTLTAAHSFPYKITPVEKPWYDLVWKDIKQQVSQEMPKMLEAMNKTIADPAYVSRTGKARQEAVSRLTGK